MSDRRVTLVAHAQSGEAAFVRDLDGVLWLITNSESRRAGEAEVHDAVSRADFHEAQRAFLSFQELDAELERIAGSWLSARGGVRDFSDLDVDEARAVFRLAGEASPVGGVSRSRIVAVRLLRECVAARDDAELYSVLLDAIAPEPARFQPATDDALVVQAVERVNAPVAA
jgi:hypothetical protein